MDQLTADAMHRRLDHLKREGRRVKRVGLVVVALAVPSLPHVAGGEATQQPAAGGGDLPGAAGADTFATGSGGSRREHLAEIGKRTRFKKGRSGNPGGRPRALSITALVRAELAKPTVAGSTVTKAQVIAQKIVNMAESGSPIFTRMIWEYMDGKPDQKLELEILDAARAAATARGLDPDNVVRLFEAARARRAGSNGRPRP